MSYMWNMFGLNTLEAINVGTGRGEEFYKLPFQLREGPKIDSENFGLPDPKPLYLYPAHLKLLYQRFYASNPKGVIFGPGEEFIGRYLSSLEPSEKQAISDDGKPFVFLFYDDAHESYSRVRKYLPELFEPGLIEKMNADPWLNVGLLGRAENEGAVPLAPGESGRWSPEWRAYCDRLLASQTYK